MTGPPHSFRFTPAMRLHSKREFDRVFAARIRASDALLTVYVAPSPGGLARLGIAVSRRYGNAVRRNRFKRLVRESFRHLRSELPAGTDWVVLPQAGIRPSFDLVSGSLAKLTTRLVQRLQRLAGPA